MLPRWTKGGKGESRETETTCVMSHSSADGSHFVRSETSRRSMFAVSEEEKLWCMIASRSAAGASLPGVSISDADVVAYITRSLQMVSTSRDAHGRGIVHACVIHGIDLSELDVELDVNVQDNDGATPLHFAAHKDNEVAARWLLARGADSRRTDRDGNTPMHAAAAISSTRLLRLFLDLEENNDAISKDERLLPSLALLAAASPVNAFESTAMLVSRASESAWKADNGLTLLGHIAAAAGNEPLLSWLLNFSTPAGGIEPLSLDARNWTVLHHAAATGSAPCCAAILNRNTTLVGVRGGSTDVSVSPLHLAVMADNEECVRLLLSRGANANHADARGRTGLHYAITVKSICVLRLLMDTGAANRHAVDVEGRTGLHYCASNDFLEGVEEIMAGDDMRAAITGVGPEAARLAAAVDMHGRTALMVAIENGSRDVVTKLLRHIDDDDIMHIGRTGRNAFHAASMLRRSDILESLVTRVGAQGIMSSLTISESSTRRPQRTHDDDLYPSIESITSTSSNSCLHLASLHNDYIECLALLLEVLLGGGSSGNGKKKTDTRMLTSRNALGLTPLHVAAASGAETAVALILDVLSDADAKETSSSEKTTVAGSRRSSISHDAAAAEAAGGSEASTSKAESDAVASPLHFACHFGNFHAVKLLLDAGRPVTDVWKGETPLHAAAASGAAHCLLLLLEHGANIDASNDAGKTALFIAARRGHMVIVTALLRLGAAITKKDKSGRTAAMAAAAVGFHDIATLIDFTLAKRRQLKASTGNAKAAAIAASGGHEETITDTGPLDLNTIAYVGNIDRQALKDAHLVKPYRRYLLTKNAPLSPSKPIIQSKPFTPA